MTCNWDINFAYSFGLWCRNAWNFLHQQSLCTSHCRIIIHMACLPRARIIALLPCLDWHTVLWNTAPRLPIILRETMVHISLGDPFPVSWLLLASNGKLELLHCKNSSRNHCNGNHTKAHNHIVCGQGKIQGSRHEEAQRHNCKHSEQSSNANSGASSKADFLLYLKGATGWLLLDEWQSSF